jgi:NAD-dependent histone deacetylase SIR2
VLYDEAHPLGDDIGTIQSMDITRKPDMLIVMGTSLKVHGLRKLVKEFAKTVHGVPDNVPSASSSSAASSSTAAPAGRPPRPWAHKVVFVNKTPPGSEWNGLIDFHVQGETDAWAERVLDDWRRGRPADWEIQQTLDLSDTFKHVKDGASGSKGKGTSKSLMSLLSRRSLLTRAAVPAAGGPRKVFAVGVENVPPLVSDFVSAAVAPALAGAAKPASSILAKRRKSTSHYTDVTTTTNADGECSPSKRRALPAPAASGKPAPRLTDDERGLLFGDATNVVEAETDCERGDGASPAKIIAQKRRTRSVDTRSRARKAPNPSRTPRARKARKVEVVISSSASSGAPRGRTARIDVDDDVDVFT